MDQQQTSVPGEQTPEEALRDAQAGLDDISSVLRQALAADDALAAKHAQAAGDRSAAGQAGATGDGAVGGR